MHSCAVRPFPSEEGFRIMSQPSRNGSGKSMISSHESYSSRLWIIGHPGSGKTTLARRLATALGSRHLELDAVYWQAGWHRLSDQEFRSALKLFIEDNQEWVIDGMYSAVADDIMAASPTILYVHRGLFSVFWRVARRTATRILQREILWNENRETLRGLFTSRSMPIYVLRSYRRKSKEADGYLERRRAQDRRAAMIADRDDSISELIQILRG